MEMQFAEQETYREQMLFTATELAGMTQEQRQEYDKTMTTKIDIIAQATGLSPEQVKAL